MWHRHVQSVGNLAGLVGEMAACACEGSLGQTQAADAGILVFTTEPLQNSSGILSVVDSWIR